MADNDAKVSALETRMTKLESQVHKLEKRAKEHDAFMDKFKKNARLFFQRLRSQLDFKF